MISGTPITVPMAALRIIDPFVRLGEDVMLDGHHYRFTNRLVSAESLLGPISDVAELTPVRGETPRFEK